MDSFKIIHFIDQIFWHIWVLLCLLCFVTFPNVPWSTSELRARLVPWNWFKPSSKIFLLTNPRQYLFCGSFKFYVLCFSCFSVCSLLPSDHLLRKLTSWLLLVMLIVFLLLPHMVSWVRCGNWLYRFLIFAIFLTLLTTKFYFSIAIQVDLWQHFCNIVVI